jgi:hypothetical protein
MNKELVIAAYDKELDWLSHLNDDVKVKVYRKGDVLPLLEGETRLEPNKGRCVHTFFKHIHDNYDNLSDITFFAQDYPFDHWEDVIEVINNETWNDRCALQIDGYYGFHFNTITTPSPKGGVMWKLSPSTQHGNGNILACQSNGFPQDKNPNINVDDYWKKLFKDNKPSIYEFIPGGHFGITKESANNRSKQFYGKIVEILESDDTAPWMIERLECYIFNKKYIINEQ